MLETIHPPRVVTLPLRQEMPLLRPVMPLLRVVMPLLRVRAKKTKVKVMRKWILALSSASKDNVIMLNVNTNKIQSYAQNNAVTNAQSAGSTKILAKTTAQS